MSKLLASDNEAQLLIQMHGRWLKRNHIECITVHKDELVHHSVYLTGYLICKLPTPVIKHIQQVFNMQLQAKLPKAGTMKSSHHALGGLAALALVPGPAAERLDIETARGHPCLQILRKSAVL